MEDVFCTWMKDAQEVLSRIALCIRLQFTAEHIVLCTVLFARIVKDFIWKGTQHIVP